MKPHETLAALQNAYDDLTTALVLLDRAVDGAKVVGVSSVVYDDHRRGQLYLRSLRERIASEYGRRALGR